LLMSPAAVMLGGGDCCRIPAECAAHAKRKTVVAFMVNRMAPWDATLHRRRCLLHLQFVPP